MIAALGLLLILSQLEGTLLLVALHQKSRFFFELRLLCLKRCYKFHLFLNARYYDFTPTLTRFFVCFVFGYAKRRYR
jgi:hypothetical protein